METATATQTEYHDHTKTYAITLGTLLVITLVEYLVGFMPTSPLKIAILVVLSLIKATFIVAIFMHVKYDKSWKQVIVFAFIIPLFLGVYLFTTLYLDYGIISGN